MLEKEFKFYVDNQEELVKKYEGKIIVIMGEEVVGVYENESEAYSDSITKHELGTFLIQECLPGKDSYTRTFYTRRVSFA